MKQNFGKPEKSGAVKPGNRKAVFTLIELLAAMGVLSIIMFVLISFFASAQKAWTMSNARAETYENARVFLDLVTRDLQCVYYVQDKVPFWHKDYQATDAPYRNEMLAFVSSTPIPQSSGDSSRQFEVMYYLFWKSVADNDRGWIFRSCTGDSEGNKWNFYENLYVGKDGTDPDGGGPLTMSAFTTGDDSRADFQKVIPYVTTMHFECYDKNGNHIRPDDQDYSTPHKVPLDDAGTTKSAFPYSVKVSVTLLDKTSWDKWIQMGGQPHSIYYNNQVEPPVLVDSDPQSEFRKRNERTFTKTIFLGERGQKY